MTRSKRILTLVLLLPCVFASTPGRAPRHQPPGIERGAPVRHQFARPDAAWVPGRLVMASADSLRLVTGAGDTLSTPAAAVAKLQVSEGRQGQAGKGALVGGIIGAGIGLAVGLAAANDDFLEASTGEVVGATALVGLGGAIFGALVGSLDKTEQWKNVPRPWLAIRATGESRGVALGFAWSQGSPEARGPGSR
jgi:hypothetical protein